MNGDPKNNFQDQNDRAFDIVSDNLEIVIEKIIEDEDGISEEGFQVAFLSIIVSCFQS